MAKSKSCGLYVLKICRIYHLLFILIITIWLSYRLFLPGTLPAWMDPFVFSTLPPEGSPQKCNTGQVVPHFSVFYYEIKTPWLGTEDHLWLVSCRPLRYQILPISNFSLSSKCSKMLAIPSLGSPWSWRFLPAGSSLLLQKDNHNEMTCESYAYFLILNVIPSLSRFLALPTSSYLKKN